LSHRQPTITGTFLDICGAEDGDKKTLGNLNLKLFSAGNTGQISMFVAAGNERYYTSAYRRTPATGV
jgi:hypothetical protein